VIVMDFGIAKAADDSNLTRTGLVIGTPAYMSPEQCLAHGVTSASDQYSLGVVAYELLTGKTPFRGSALEMQWSHATAGPPAVRSLRPDCPPDLEALVLGMLGKTAADRWPSLHDVSHALADDPATVTKARAALVRLVDEAPSRRDSAMPTTPASPVPIGPGFAAARDATTDPLPNVVPPSPPLLTLSQQRIELGSGESVELIVELEAGEQSMDTSAVAWETSNPNVVRVSRDGYVTAIGPGLAEVACVWRGRRAVCEVYVSPAATPAAPAAVMAIPAAPRAAPSQPMSLPAATPATGPKRRWWMGVLAASIVTAFAYVGLRPESESPPVTSVALLPDTAGRGAQPPAPSSAPPNAVPAQVVDRAPTQPSQPRGKTGTSTAAAPQPKAATSQANASPPTLPLPRVDSSRLITNRTDSNAASSSAPPATAAARDSAVSIPAPSRDVASDLFKDFATAINQRSYSRITASYSEPSDAASVKLWQEFLIFVRDYTPRVTVRSVTINPATTPPTITAELAFRWSSDAGFDRTRAATFSGVALPTNSGGWQLHRAHLTKKFW
jgi:serine/threonine-protein kinase